MKLYIRFLSKSFHFKKLGLVKYITYSILEITNLLYEIISNYIYVLILVTLITMSP